LVALLWVPWRLEAAATVRQVEWVGAAAEAWPQVWDWGDVLLRVRSRGSSGHCFPESAVSLPGVVSTCVTPALRKLSRRIVGSRPAWTWNKQNKNPIKTSSVTPVEG
jgi:hypothetical protein